MRDLETISLAITASETGHLVLGTLHTGNASRTLDRIALDAFLRFISRIQIRIMVSESLRGVISQQLIPRIDGQLAEASRWKHSPTRPRWRTSFAKQKTFMLPGIIQTG